MNTTEFQKYREFKNLSEFKNTVIEIKKKITKEGTNSILSDTEEQKSHQEDRIMETRQSE